MNKRIKVTAFMLCVLCLFSFGCAAEQGVGEITLQMERIEDPNGYEVVGVIKAYQNGAVIWEFTTPATYNTEHKGLSEVRWNQDAAYIMISGTLHALDIHTGAVRWTVPWIQGTNCIALDDYGNVYVSAYYRPNLVVVNPDGKVMYWDENTSYAGVYDLQISGSIIEIYYGLNSETGRDGVDTMDISRFWPQPKTDIPFAATDYITVFGAFIDNGLEQLLVNEYKTCDIEFFKDCFMVDMNNDTVPELLCIFYDTWSGNEYAVLVEYDGTFKLGEEIPFNFITGSAGTEQHRVLKANGKFYFEEYFAALQNPDSPNSWRIRQNITIQEDGIEYIEYHATSDYGTHRVNGEYVAEWDSSFVTNNFEIVADGFDYEESFTYQPSLGADYAKFWDAPAPQAATAAVTLNGEAVQFDQPPIIVDGRTLVPVRAVVEKMGGTVLWLAETRTAVLELDGSKIELTIDSTTAFLNGDAKTLDVPPQIIGDRTLLPIRFIAEGFGFDVTWDDGTKTVVITK